MAVTATDIVNQAIQYIGDNTAPVTGAAPTFDSSPAGKAAAILYAPCVQTVARQFGWDFARNTAALVATGNAAPFPWSFEYLYPGNGVQVWQLIPAAPAPDPNNPLPVNWVVANAIVGGAQKKVIQCDLADPLAVYNNTPGESTWDPLFREAVARLLASELGMALAGRPDTAAAMLDSGARFEGAAEQRMN